MPLNLQGDAQPQRPARICAPRPRSGPGRRWLSNCPTLEPASAQRWTSTGEFEKAVLPNDVMDAQILADLKRFWQFPPLFHDPRIRQMCEQSRTFVNMTAGCRPLPPK